MANSYEQSLGDGSNTQFSIPFPYISKTHVHVYVDGAEDSDFTWINAGQIQTSITPANGAVIERRRVTPTGPLVDFVDGSTLAENDLDKASLQTLYLVEESADIAADTMKPGNDGAFDALNKRIANVAPASAAGDAVNKAQLDAATMVAGNVPTPGGSNIGKYLKALTATTWGWVAFGWTELSALLSANAVAARTAIGLGTAAVATVGASVGNLIAWDTGPKYPAGDGSQLTKLADGVGGALTSEAGVVTTSSSFRMYAPFAFTVTDIFASLNTAQSAGSVLTYQVAKNGTTILSSAGTFANGANTSTNAVISGTVTFAKGDRIDITVTQVGNSTAAGMKVAVNGTR